MPIHLDESLANGVTAALLEVLRPPERLFRGRDDLPERPAEGRFQYPVHEPAFFRGLEG